MYTLYWAKGSANMVCHAAMIEMGVPFKLVEIDVDSGQQKSPDYLKLNPNARVPTLIEDGRVMYESAAILLYLCEKHPQAGLMPAGRLTGARPLPAMAVLSDQHAPRKR